MNKPGWAKELAGFKRKHVPMKPVDLTTSEGKQLLERATKRVLEQHVDVIKALAKR